jgi:feruloyl esterase
MKMPKTRVLLLRVKGRIGQFLLGFAGFAGLYLLLGCASKAVADCASLANLVIESTTITATALVPAGGGLPEYCQVLGHVDAEIGFQVRLPTAWNGKLYFGGNAGFAGTIPAYPAMSTALGRGYATALTDTGHQAGMNDGSWALNNPERQINFYYRAIHVVSVAAKRIIEAYYGHVPALSYFQGCSNGGRQALIEAQRYPADFNGIIAESPVLDQMGAILGYAWKAQAAQAAVPSSKISLLANAVLAECDAKDGLKDGLISDPRLCQFDPQTLQCAAGDAPGCLTAAEVQAVRMIYAGPVNSAGERLYPGTPQGHETYGPATDGWPLWITGNGSGPTRTFQLQEGWLRYFIFGPDYDSLTFNFDTDPLQLATVRELANATNPDLSAFQANGGKLIAWQGWSDPDGPSPFRTIEYYDAVVQTFGGYTDQFFRLFMAPGVYHCGSPEVGVDGTTTGPGPNNFDTLTALEGWVEGGVAPDRIIASHSTGGVVDRTRPLCPYPQQAGYVGKGSIDDAANFVCTRTAADDQQ